MLLLVLQQQSEPLVTGLAATRILTRHHRLLIVKDPDSTENLTVPWSGVTASDIVSSSFSVPVGLVKLGQDYSGTDATVRISGGTLGRKYTITNTVATESGETLVYRFRVLIERLR